MRYLLIVLIITQLSWRWRVSLSRVWQCAASALFNCAHLTDGSIKTRNNNRIDSFPPWGRPPYGTLRQQIKSQMFQHLSDTFGICHDRKPCQARVHLHYPPVSAGIIRAFTIGVMFRTFQWEDILKRLRVADLVSWFLYIFASRRDVSPRGVYL